MNRKSRGITGFTGARVTSFEGPAVLVLWSTNLHERLITGDKSFVVIPDGRHYGIDLVKGVIAEGEEGDLVAWIKRPEPVARSQRYDWSCELKVPGGGVLESQTDAMFTAPGVGYTNMFAYQEDAGANGWGNETAEKRFYLRLRNEQMYGRMTVKLFAQYNAQNPGLIRLSYAINPSGSRLLR